LFELHTNDSFCKYITVNDLSGHHDPHLVKHEFFTFENTKHRSLFTKTVITTVCFNSLLCYFSKCSGIIFHLSVKLQATERRTELHTDKNILQTRSPYTCSTPSTDPASTAFYS